MLRPMTTLLTVVLVALPAQAQFNLEKLKKVADTALDVAEQVDRFTFTEDEEVQLGLAISERIRARYGVAQDPEVTRYLSLVGGTVAQRTDRPSIPWRWIVLDSDAVNAFAAPGGFVHVTRGALAIIDSEAELAGVLAHEAAHVTEKHTLKALQKSMGMELAQEQASFGVGTALFEAVADQAAQAILAGFGQSEELEADRVGLQVAARVGYQAAGLTHFLESLKALTAGSSSRSALFRSHPETDERIKRLNKEIKKEDLESGVWLAERYAASVPYDEVSASTGGPVLAGERGVAGSSDDEAGTEDAPTEDTSAEDATADNEKSDKGKFSLAKLANPFAMDAEEESTEVTGAGAGRAVGEEAGEGEGGIKNTEMLQIEITPEELATFQREGGLK